MDADSGAALFGRIDQICREQRRASAFCGGGAGERYVSNRIPIAGLTGEKPERTHADNNEKLGATAA